MSYQFGANLMTERNPLIETSADVLKPKISVLLASNCSIWCTGARSIVHDTEFEILGQVRSYSQALETVQRTPSDILLLDTGILGGDGMEQLCALKETYPGMAVVLLNTTLDPKFMVRAIEGGAAGCLLMGIANEDLLYALRAIINRANVITLSL